MSADARVGTEPCIVTMFIVHSFLATVARVLHSLQPAHLCLSCSLQAASIHLCSLKPLYDEFRTRSTALRSGVKPESSRRFGSAPWASSKRSDSHAHVEAAWWSGVSPPENIRPFGSAPDSSKSATAAG